jgi:type VI protein secretion system component VasF
MNSELKKRLLANVIQGTKSTPISYRKRKRLPLTFGGMITAVAMFMAFIGLFMLLLSIIRPYF